MNKRIAKKVLNNYKCSYSAAQWVKAHRRLGNPVPGRRRIEVDKAADDVKDFTGIHVFNTDTGRTSSTTLNEASKPKSTFHHRTGQAPTTPGAIAPTSLVGLVGLVGYDDMTLTDLKDAAKAKGLKGYSTMKKADLVALLKG